MIKKEEEKDLEIINYSDIPYNHFNNWLTDCIYENTEYIFDTDLDYFASEDLEDNKIIDIRDLDIKFRLENDYDDDFDYAVYCKYKDSEEWEYLDNISPELYNQRLE